MSKRLNMSNDEAVEWLLSLKNLDICGENRKTAINKAITALKAHPTRVEETYLSIKDAISELKAMREHIVGYMSIVGTTAYDMGIEALEAQPCIEDYPTCTECEHYDSEKHYCPRFCQVIKDTLAETQSCKDSISREEAKQFLYERIDRLNDDELYDIFSRIIDDMYNELPSVTPQRPKGKWIEVDVRNCHATLKCSVCDRVITPTFTFGEYSYEDIKTFYPYCHCGAEMSGGGEDEDSN